MKNIYSPEDIDRITEVTIGRLETIGQLEPGNRAYMIERRAAFIATVGEQVAREVDAFRSERREKVIVFAGDTICGAYALEAALELHARGCKALVVLFNVGGNLLSIDTAAARSRFLESTGSRYLIEVLTPGDFEMPDINPADTIVLDGIFGSEYRKPLLGGYQAVARHINESGARVVSIDLPSGMTTDLSVGMINRNIVHADLTLTLVGPTLAFFLPENAELVGRWKTLAVPFNEEAMSETRCTSQLIDARGVRKVYPKREFTVSKADLGDALIFAGSYGMVGAAVLATRAATRSGCGRVTCHGPRCAYVVLQTAVPSAMFAAGEGDTEIRSFDNPRDCEAVAIGPGIGQSDATADALEAFLKNCYAARRPLVLDADALNLIAKHHMHDYIPERSVITPHAGEFDRLFGLQNSDGTRLLMAIEMAARYKIIIVLKGPKTMTIWPNGVVIVNSSGTEALATAGSGDVLTGLLTGLIAQGLRPEYAAVVAVYIHGVAGRIAARTCGVEGSTAEDIADAIGPAIDSILNPRTTAQS
ncbi:MAG: NAD(P)H-hydrate dehydratase [Muribaculaceae bacterium]|nr:NAD(P)H-hydrate dehydratase [Muribaculaceae bacterium]